jgi:hemoglobin/transferrin/lactoferrin receptor protein
MILTSLLASLAFAIPQQEPAAPSVQDPVSESTQEAPKTQKAHGTPDDHNTPMAKEIVVIATRLAESLFEVPRSVTVIDSQTLKEKTPRTAAEALRQQPGIWIQRTGHSGGAPIIRGFMGKRVIYMFDGIRRNTASLFNGPNGTLGTIDALDIDRIEVLRGPGSVLYGSDAIGGVINVISNENPMYTDGGLKSGGRLHTRYASADHEASARLEAYVAGSKAYAFVGATRRNIGDVTSGRDGWTQTPSSWHEKNFDIEAGYRISENQDIQFFTQSFNRPDSTRYDKPTRITSNDRDLYGLRYRISELGFADEATVSAYYHRQKKLNDDPTRDSLSLDRSVGLEMQLEKNFDSAGSRLAYGLSAIGDDVAKSNPQAGTRDPDAAWTDFAAFALMEMYVTDNLRVDLGLRADRTRLKFSTLPFGDLDPLVQDAINNGELSMSDLALENQNTALTGGLGLSWFLTDNLSVFTHASRAFRAPNKSDLFSFGPFTNGFNVPSPDVDPESAWSYEFGFRGQNENMAWEATGFYTELDNAIVSEPGTFNGSSFVDLDGNGVQDPGEQVYVKYNSSDKVIVKGVELQGTHYLPQQWTNWLAGNGAMSVYGNASWIDGTNQATDEAPDRLFPTNALLGLRWENSRNPQERTIWVGFEAWMVDSFDDIPSSRAGDPAFKVDPQDRSTGLLAPGPRVPGFSTFTLRGGVQVNDRVSVSLGVENLGDRLYRVKDSRIDAPGINFVAAVDFLL